MGHLSVHEVYTGLLELKVPQRLYIKESNSHKRSFSLEYVFCYSLPE